MKAMVLAAGLGTRLRPLTNERPKALVQVAGRTLLQITLSRLAGFGVHDVIINAHHFADMLCEYLAAHGTFGVNLEVSREDVLLDTGGGLKKAAPFFLRGGSDDPFILHNVDVISTIDLNSMLQQHRRTGALATLAVQPRETSRHLLFNDELELCGRRAGGGQEDEIVRAAHRLTPLAFSGIHVISPRLLGMIREEGVFSIVTTYLRLAQEGEKISGFRADGYYWRDMGKPESITQVERDIESGKVQL
jgi:NDP-sugar pyrophosphorylase family protein